jgi:hypothetical protein
MTITRKMAVLAEHSAALVRDPGEIEKTVSTRLGDGESAEQFAQRCRALDGLGVEQALVLCAGPWTAAELAKLAAARPLLDRVDRADRADRAG